MRTHDPALPTERGTATPPLYGARLLWLNGRLSQQLLSSCSLGGRSHYARISADARLSGRTRVSVVIELIENNGDVHTTRVFTPLRSAVGVNGPEVSPS